MAFTHRLAQIALSFRAGLVLLAIWYLTHWLDDQHWMLPMQEDGSLYAIRETCLVVISVGVCEWLLPRPGVRQLVGGGEGVDDLSPLV